MFGMMLFLHLTGLVLWFGSLLAMALVILLSKKLAVSQDARTIVRKTIRTFGWLAQPSAVVVLVSGIIMIIDMNFGEADKPMWLSYMEKGGGMIILIAIAFTAVLGRKMVKRLGENDVTGGGAAMGGSLYLTSLIVILAAILSVILLVSLRL